MIVPWKEADRRLIYKTSHQERKVFLRYDSLAKSINHKIVWDDVHKLANDIHKRTLSTLSVTIVRWSYDKLKIILYMINRIVIFCKSGHWISCRWAESEAGCVFAAVYMVFAFQHCPDGQITDATAAPAGGETRRKRTHSDCDINSRVEKERQCDDDV